MSASVDYPPNCGPLSPTAGNSEILKKLRSITEALQSADSNEDCHQPNRYQSLVHHLTKTEFLENTNKEVQINLACCYADLLRIFSPNCPISDMDKLKDVLLFIVRALRGLGDPKSPGYRRHYYLIENITMMDTMFLCLDLPDEQPQVVIRQLIKTSLEIAGKIKVTVSKNGSENGSVNEEEDDAELDEENGESGSKVLGMLCSMINKLLRQVDQITNNVLDALFFYIINPQKECSREAYQMGKQLIQSSQTVLEASIQSLLTRSVLSGTLPPEFELVGQSKTKLFEVFYELHEIAPELVYPVLPQFQQDLCSEVIEERLNSTRLIGNILVNPNSRLPDEQPTIWESYLKRFTDISEDVRNLCCKQSISILLNHPSLRGPITNRLKCLIRDEQESVRMTAIVSVCSVAKKKLEAVSEQLITACAERIFDRKPKVRMEALRHLLMLHQKIFKEEGYTASDRSSLSIVIQKTFSLYSHPEMVEEKVLIEKFFVSSIVPYKLPVEKRVEALIEVFTALPSVEATVFSELVNRQSLVRRALLDIMNLVARQGGSSNDEIIETMKKEVEKRMAKIATGQPEPHKVISALRQFTNFISNDQRAFQLMEYNVGPRFECEKVEENMKEFLKKGTEKRGEDRALSEDACSIVRSIMERSMPLQLDEMTAQELSSAVFQKVRRAECGDVKYQHILPKVLQLWKIYAEAFPHCFASPYVTPTIIEIARRDSCPTAVESALRILHAVCEQNSVKVADQPWIKDVVSVCEEKAREGSGRAAKWAVKVICRSLGREEAKDTVLGLAKEAISHLSIDDPYAVCAMQTIGVSVKAYPNEMREELRSAMTERISKIILSYDVSDDDQSPPFDGLTPLDTDNMPSTIRTKVFGMKCLVHFLVAVNRDDYDHPLVLKTINVLGGIVSALGDLHEGKTSQLERAWMRAVAGKSLLRLAYVPKYCQLIPVTKLHSLTLLVLDEFDCVRSHFLRRLRKALTRVAVGVEFVGLLSVAPLLKEDDSNLQKRFLKVAQQTVEQACVRRAQLIKGQTVKDGFLSYYQPELALAYSIHFLAHQPMFTGIDDEDVLYEMKECLWFFIELFISKKDKFDLDTLYATLQMVKDATDASCNVDADKEEKINVSKKLWVLADLAMVMIIYRSKRQIQSRPLKLVLSKRFFVVMKTKAGNMKLYAPESLIEEEKSGKGRVGKKKTVNTSTMMSSRGGRGGGGKRGGGRRGRPRGVSSNTILEESEGEEDGESVEKEEGSDSGEEEIMPKAKRRGNATSTSPRVKTNGIQLEEENEEDDFVLPSTSRIGNGLGPGVSPIVGNSGRGRRGKMSNGPQASSTPMNKENKVLPRRGSKRGAEKEDKEEERKPTPKRARSGNASTNVSPKKKEKKEEIVEEEEGLEEDDWEEPVIPKGRGRPSTVVAPKISPKKRKSGTPAQRGKKKEESEGEEEVVEKTEKRGRGRQSKTPVSSPKKKRNERVESEEKEEVVEKRGRGRPAVSPLKTEGKKSLGNSRNVPKRSSTNEKTKEVVSVPPRRGSKRSTTTRGRGKK